MATLHIDLESRSVVDLKKAGVYVYAADPRTDVLCCAYAIDDEPPRLWVPRQPLILGDSAVERHEFERDAPPGIEYVLSENYTIVAHNAQFERTLWNEILGPRYGWPIPRLDQWRCTMVMGLALSLPASLKKMTRAIGIEDGGKAEDGERLMKQMMRPRKARKGEDPTGLYWFDDDARIKRLGEVCKKDVADEREAHRRLLELRPSEQKLWELDQAINDRGVYVDMPLCQAALRVVDTATRWLNDEMRELTGGAVPATTNVAEIVAWLCGQGVTTESIDKENVDELLARADLSPVVRRVLEIRREAAKAAVKKIDALIAGRSVDGRARGLLQFHAAGTGRWAGRRFQPQNIKRPDLVDVDGAIDTVATGSAEIVRLVYGEPLATVGDCLRGMIGCAPGNKLIAADFSNIEGRIIAWLADEEWKLDAFRAFDAGTGADIYKLAVAELFGIPVESVTKEQRQKVGKVQELASGFQGGIAAYMRFGIEEAFPILIPTMRESAAGEEWDKAWGSYTPLMANGLSREQYTAVRLAVQRWRRKHANVEQFWYDLENAAQSAIRERGKMFDCGRLRFRVAGSFLFMRLPSGRCIAYPYPCIKPKKTPWGEMRDQVSYKGVDTFTHQWTDCYAHGGLIFNNAVQGTARDVEAEAMTRVETAGYPIVLTVHDEIVCEVAKDFGSINEFHGLMVQLPVWAAGLPIAAEAWSGERYRK